MFSHYDTIPARDRRTDDRFVVVMQHRKYEYCNEPTAFQ